MEIHKVSGYFGITKGYDVLNSDAALLSVVFAEGPSFNPQHSSPFTDYLNECPGLSLAQPQQPKMYR